MSRGTFSITRQIWDHAAFKREKFTEREAWIWMLGEASWKPRVTRAGDLVVALDRGELVLSSRFAAKCWGWTDSKVRRFVERLQKLEMVSAKTDAGVTVVNICNYDIYQPGGAPTDAGPTQDRRRTDANENKGIREDRGNKKEESSLPPDGGAPSAPSTPVPANEVSEAVAAYNIAAEKAGWPLVKKMSPARTRSLKARLKECGGVDGWKDALRRAYASDFCRQSWKGFGFDSLTSQQKFIKLMEGNYDNRDQHQGRARNAGGSGQGNSLASIAARRRAQRDV